VFQLAIISNANLLLKQVENGTVIKMSNLKDYDHFLKRCIDGKVPHFTHAVDANKLLRIVLLNLPNWPVDDVKQALAEGHPGRHQAHENSKSKVHHRSIIYHTIQGRSSGAGQVRQLYDQLFQTLEK
jgi:hypothetical protein